MQITQKVEIDLNVSQVIEAIRNASQIERDIILRSIKTPSMIHLNRTVGDEWTESLLERLRGLGVAKLDDLVNDLEARGIL